MIRLAALAAALALSGCSFSGVSHYGQVGFSLFQLAPGDEVQTQTQTLTGIDLSPAGRGGPRIFVGYARNQNTRVPAFDSGVPDVKVKSKVDAETGVSLGETLTVSD